MLAAFKEALQSWGTACEDKALEFCVNVLEFRDALRNKPAAAGNDEIVWDVAGAAPTVPRPGLFG